jgi:hypothetical protein
MNLEATKIELIEMLVKTSKASVLEKIKVILEDDQEELTQDDFKIIESDQALISLILKQSSSDTSPQIETLTIL